MNEQNNGLNLDVRKIMESSVISDQGEKFLLSLEPILKEAPSVAGLKNMLEKFENSVDEFTYGSWSDGSEIGFSEEDAFNHIVRKYIEKIPQEDLWDVVAQAGTKAPLKEMYIRAKRLNAVKITKFCNRCITENISERTIKEKWGTSRHNLSDVCAIATVLKYKQISTPINFSLKNYIQDHSDEVHRQLVRQFVANKWDIRDAREIVEIIKAVAESAKYEKSILRDGGNQIRAKIQALPDRDIEIFSKQVNDTTTRYILKAETALREQRRQGGQGAK